MTESPRRLHHVARHDLLRLTAIRSFASWLAVRSRREPEKKIFFHGAGEEGDKREMRSKSAEPGEAGEEGEWCGGKEGRMTMGECG